MSILLLALAAQAAGQQVTTFHRLPQEQPQQQQQQQQQQPPTAPPEQIRVLSVTVPGQTGQPAQQEPAGQPSNPASVNEATGATDTPAQTSAPAATASTAPAMLQTGPILWRNITSGMSVADLRALYPQGTNVHYKNDRTVLSDVPVIEGCEAKVNIMHRAGVVEEIVMRGEGSLAGRCSLKIITALSGKYGESLEKDEVRGSILARKGKNYVWMRDGITLQLKRYTSGALGGGGLFAASWELRYSANATDIDL